MNETMQDYVMNGQGYGEIGRGMAEVGLEPNYRRPFTDERGRRCVIVNTGRKRTVERNGQKMVAPIYKKALIDNVLQNGIQSPVFNAALLRKEEWIQLDQVVLRAARQRLRAWADLAAANSYGGFNGMAKLILEHEAMSDPGEAVMDMWASTPARTDTALFALRGLPLPITHSDFYCDARVLAASRNSGTPFDTRQGEAAGRRVAELVEDTLIGTATGLTYGGANTPTYEYAPTIYGYTNFPYAASYVGTAPTGSNQSTTVADVLAMRSTAYANRFYGPFMVYHSTGWDQYLDADYILTGGNVATQTLRERLKKIEGILDVRRLDRWTSDYKMVMVQMTPDVCRAVNGMDITTVQWESSGGMRLNFKVMAIQVPQIFTDYSHRTGIVNGAFTK